MLGFLRTATRTLGSTARPCVCRAPAAPLQPRLFSTSSPVLSLLHAAPRPSFAPSASPSLPPSHQVRTFKMPSCMRKKKSPIARNGGAGKTARKHSARAAKRRRQRAKKIN
ncbi:hypothetical protein JCM5296_006004 [Sporobolomyces johnsonii]